MSKEAKVIISILVIAVFAMVIGQVLHQHQGYSDLLPPINHWTNCRNLPEVCDVPELENNSLSDLAVYRFENGSMIVEYVGDAPIDK